MAYDLELPLPPGWLEIAPDAAEDPEGWAVRATHQVAADAPEHHRERLARHLTAVAVDSARRGPLFTALLLGPGPGPVVLALEVWSLQPDPGVPLTVDGLAEQQRSAAVETALDPDVDVVDLPLGPAVRVHRILPGEVDASMQRSLVEEVTHFVLPTATPGEGLLVTATWPDLALGEQYTALVDDAVRRITVTPSP